MKTIFFFVSEWGLLKSLRSKESTKQMGQMGNVQKLKSRYQRQGVRLGKNVNEGVWLVCRETRIASFADIASVSFLEKKTKRKEQERNQKSWVSF